MKEIVVKLNTKEILDKIKSGTLPFKPIKFLSVGEAELSLFIKMDSDGKIGDDAIFISDSFVYHKENEVDSFVTFDPSKWYFMKRASLPEVICKINDVRYDVYNKKCNNSLFEADTVIVNDAILVRRKEPAVEVAWYHELELDLLNVSYIEEISKDEVDDLKGAIRRIGVVMVPGISKKG